MSIIVPSCRREWKINTIKVRGKQQWQKNTSNTWCLSLCPDRATGPRMCDLGTLSHRGPKEAFHSNSHWVCLRFTCFQSKQQLWHTHISRLPGHGSSVLKSTNQPLAFQHLYAEGMEGMHEGEKKISILSSGFFLHLFSSHLNAFSLSFKCTTDKIFSTESTCQPYHPQRAASFDARAPAHHFNCWHKKVP